MPNVPGVAGFEGILCQRARVKNTVKIAGDVKFFGAKIRVICSHECDSEIDIDSRCFRRAFATAENSRTRVREAARLTVIRAAV
jgi:hypothetical protein